MAKAGASDCLARRDLLNDPQAQKARLLAGAEERLSAEVLYDAIDLLAKAGQVERLEALAAQAARTGDLFNHLHALRALGQKPDPATLRNLAAAARSQGQLLFAARAETLAQSLEPKP